MQADGSDKYSHFLELNAFQLRHNLNKMQLSLRFSLEIFLCWLKGIFQMLSEVNW